jgi:hypothetical protein
MKMAEVTMENGITDREWVAKELHYYQDAEKAAIERIKSAESVLARARADLASAKEALTGARGGIAGFSWQMEQMKENGLHNSP